VRHFSRAYLTEATEAIAESGFPLTRDLNAATTGTSSWPRQAVEIHLDDLMSPVFRGMARELPEWKKFHCQRGQPTGLWPKDYLATKGF